VAFGLLQVSKVLVLDPNIVGVVGFHGLLSPIRSTRLRLNPVQGGYLR
jgi:hypothetical protein